ncbi:VOC family protein [Natronosalvus vescus]|uniref:VOC family protein n=1 Tax=Natronosalvus vescus TaxID=2953881 RepID=UPI002090167D|nr:VOC family protein [Natronosalvus vescus]
MTDRPASNRTGALHHLELYASDLDRSVAFWSWLLAELGYEPYQEWETGRSWKLDSTYLVLVEAEARFRDEGYHRCHPGLNHLAFHAESRDYVDDLTERCRDRGVPILYEDRHPHAGGPDHYALYVEDPERIKVELVAPSA